jgi:YVTN family beta-propeller protein
MDTVMRYGVETNPSPLQASPATGDLTKVSMTIVVSNPTDSTVTLEGLTVTLPIGDSGTDLTADWKDIDLVPAAHWNLYSTTPHAGQVQYDFRPDSDHGSVGGDGLSFELHNIEVNRQPGTFEVVVTERSGGCDPSSNCPKFPKPISKFPNGWGQVSFWVDPADVPQGGQVYLHWDGPAAALPDVVTYTIEYTDQQTQKIVQIPGTGQPPLPAKGQYPQNTRPGIIVQQSTEFTLNVSATFEGQNYHTQLQKTVTVAKPLPKICCFTAAWEDGQLKLKWKTEHAKDVEISNIPGEQKANDSIYFQPSPQQPLPFALTLTATNETGISVCLTLVPQQWLPVSGSLVYYGRMDAGFGVAVSRTRVFLAGFSPDGLVVLDAQTLSPVGSPVPFPRSDPFCVTVSPDGTRVFVGTVSKTLKVLDAQTLAPVGSPVSLDGQPRGVAVSHDSARVFVRYLDNKTFDGRLVVLNAETLKIERSSVSVGSGLSCGVAVSHNGKSVFVTDDYNDKLVVLDAQTLEPVGSPVSVGELPYGVAVSPDGRHVLVGIGNTLVVLDAQTLKPVGSPVPLGGIPKCVVVSPDGARVFVGSEADPKLKVYYPAAYGQPKSG